MKASAEATDLYFLSGGGEMGELTRNFDWEKTSLGPPEEWPQSLRLTLSMILASKFPMFLWWGEELIQFYNDAYRPSLGNNGKHPLALGQKAEDCWQEIWETIYPLILQVRTTAQATWSEDQLIPIYRNGKLEDVYWTFGYSPIFGDSRKVEGVLVVCTETTEKVKTRIALENSENRVRTVVLHAPFPIGVYIGKEMTIEVANPAILKAWGKGDDVTGKSYKEILPELAGQEIFEQIENVFLTGIPFHAKNQRVDLVVDNKLQPFYFNYNFTPLADASGKIYGVMNTAADITDLNLAKQKTELSERNLRNVILQAPVAMCLLVGPKHTVEVANELMIALWGKRAADVLNKPIFEGLPDAKEQGLEELLDNVFQTGETFKASELPVSLVRFGQQEIVYMDFVYEPYRDGDGKIAGVLAVATDVTEKVYARHKTEELIARRTKELARANDELQKSNAELAQFAYIASHDLQEPLRKISSFTQMLGHRVGDSIDELSKHYLAKIQGASSRMHTLIRDVLTYSELIKENEGFEKTDLNQVAKDVITDYELLIEEKGAEIYLDPLPVIEANPLQMSQLFGNIIGNALKYSRKNVKPVIRVTVSEVGAEDKKNLQPDSSLEYINIRFADNGIGFKKEYSEQIFNIFQRLHRKSEYAGTGIGLAMCKKIALNHHGDLNASGASEDGAVFNVILPLRQNKA